VTLRKAVASGIGATNHVSRSTPLARR
jgi:hypothetical protein